MEKAARYARRAARAAPLQTPTLRLSVEGGPSNEGVPLTGRGGQSCARHLRGGGKRHLTTAISVDGTPSCPGTGRQSTVAVEMSVPTTRSLRKRGHHHRHRFKRHTSHEHESKYSALRPSERVVIDAVLCDGRKKLPPTAGRPASRGSQIIGAVSFERAVAAEAAACQSARAACAARGAKAKRSLLSSVMRALVRRLERRGVLCSKTRLCDARVLPSCPVRM